jgi:hypothetical protein
MSYSFQPAYPTPQHARSAQAISHFFAGRVGVSAVLLTCSCARGRASRDSCLDIAVLLQPGLPAADKDKLRAAWEGYYQGEALFAEQRQVGAFSQVDLDFCDGQFDPAHFEHGWTSGADAFELEVGNLLAYSHPLWQGDERYASLRAQWLPYYPTALARARQAMVLRYCRNNLAHIPLYVQRGLYFQAFKRLYCALEEFLQALFIARRTYPIAYDKWIHEQVVEILGLPELYPQLVSLLETHHLESWELAEKAATMENLISRYIV